MEYPLNLVAWTAWSAFCHSRNDWQSWAKNPVTSFDRDTKPKLEFVPAMARRRLSPLSRAMYHCAYTLREHCPEGTQSVFCSRHGEQDISQSLLKSIALDEPLSPLRFSVSVHNSASGSYSIFSKNTAASTAIAGGMVSFFKGLVEASLLLNQSETDQVLYVYGDEPPSELFETVITEPNCLYSVAIVLAKGDTGCQATLSHKVYPEYLDSSVCVALNWMEHVFNSSDESFFRVADEGWEFETDSSRWVERYHEYQ